MSDAHTRRYCTETEILDIDRADLSTGERKNYISALQCLLNKPSQADPAVFPGARNRYDDFVAVHMNQTLTIHGTVREYKTTLLLLAKAFLVVSC